MALQSSGAISLADVQTEFGGANPISISEYYRGGAYVINSNFTSGIPTSGTISLSNFYGAAAAPPIPYTNYMRSSSTQNAVYGEYSRTADIVRTVAAYAIRLRRADPYVYLEVKENLTPPTSYWYAAGTGAQNTLSTSYVTMLRFNLTGITQIALDWTVTTTGNGTTNVSGNASAASSTYAATRNTFQTVSNGQSIGAYLVAYTYQAECYESFNADAVVSIWASARKTGYLDTKIGRWRINTDLTATSNACR